jgi:hypothetical protein
MTSCEKSQLAKSVGANGTQNVGRQWLQGKRELAHTIRGAIIWLASYKKDCGASGRLPLS